MAITAKYALLLDVEEGLSLSLDLVSNPNAKHTIAGSFGQLTASTTVPATKVISDTRSLTAGADTIDLTNMGGPAGSTVTFLNLKVQLLKIKAASANSAAIVFVDGASNGYNIFGDSSGSVTLLPGCECLFSFKDNLDDVASGDKTIDVSSADTDATYSIIIVAG